MHETLGGNNFITAWENVAKFQDMPKCPPQKCNRKPHKETIFVSKLNRNIMSCNICEILLSCKVSGTFTEILGIKMLL